MDVDSFKRLFLSLHPKLYRVAYAWVENKADAEDILQDAYYKLWSRRAELEIQEKLQQISRLSNDLPDKQRQVLRLRSMPWPIAMPASATI